MAVTRSGDQIIIDGDNGGSDVVSTDTNISAASADDSFNDSTSGFSGLTDGDIILVTGFSNAENNGQFIVESMTTTKIVVKETGRIVTESEGNSVTVRERGPGYSLADIDSALNPGDEAYFDILAYPGATHAGLTLSASARAYAYIMNARLSITAGSLLKDHSAIFLHTYNSVSNDAILMADVGSTIELGYLDEDDPDLPITVLGGTESAGQFACVYSFMSSQSGQIWNDGGAGIFNMYGGMIRFRDDTAGGKSYAAGENENYEVTFPYETAIIQCNVENFGGATFNGTLYRVQESTFKTSRNTGIDFAGTTVRRMKNIITMNSLIGIDLTGAGSPSVQELRLRGHTDDLRVNGFTGDLILLNSDTIVELHVTMNFGTGGSLLEGNTYDLELVDISGDGVDDMRCAVYRKSDGTVYGSEEVSAGGGSGIPAVVPTLYPRRNLYDETYESSPLAYGNFGIRVRHFDYLFMDIEKVPGEAALEDTFILLDDGFLTETTEATVAAYTGFAIDEGDQEVDITTAHTMDELYDWLKWKQYQSGLLDTPALAKTKDGVSFTIHDDWDINPTSLENLDLGTKFFINRYVPVNIEGIVSGTECAVVRASDKTTLISTTSTGTSINLCTPYAAATNVHIRARKAGYKPFSILVTLGSTGNIVNAALKVDGAYN